MKQETIGTTTQDNILTRPTNQLLNDFGAGKASPGSGSAAALLALLASKMITTVCDKSSEKEVCSPSFSEFELLVKNIKESVEPSLKNLFEKDARDFERVVELRISRNRAKNPTDKAKFARESLDLLEVVTDYTFEVAELGLKLMEYGVVTFKDGWHAVRGDSGVAISAAMSAVMSSIFIINLNLKTLSRRKYAHDGITKVQELQKKLDTLQTKAFSCVTDISTESLESIQLDLE